MNYSLFRSRTFWTLVVLVIYDVIQVYGNIFPAEIATLINLILGSLVSYYHLQTGQSVSGSN